MTILGFDLSLNHSGAVALDAASEVEGYWFTSDKKRAVDQGKGQGVRSPIKPKGMYSENFQLRRIIAYQQWFWDIVRESGVEYAGVEGYAYNAKTLDYKYGELGGLWRLCFARAHCPFRVHDPQSVKLFATGKGNVTAARMLEALPEVLRDKWERIEKGLKGQQVAEDLAVAYWIARIVWTEVELRAGRVLLSSLEPHEIRVFNRVTKAYPVNLLDRKWVTL